MCSQIDDLVRMSNFNGHVLTIELLKMFQLICKFQVVKKILLLLS